MQDPFADKTVYADGPIDKLFIKLFTQKMADQLQGVSGVWVAWVCVPWRSHARHSQRRL
jgi:hypothetical protein